MSIISVRELGVHNTATNVELVTSASFEIAAGERIGLIGESGSGKSLTALSLLGLLPAGLTAQGDVRLAGVAENLLQAGERRLSTIRGRLTGMVFQEPMTALNPTMRIVDQVAEPMIIHRLRSRAEARGRAVELLAEVGIPEPANAARAYPHQLSGGQRQRVIIAIALACDPKLLICDEPTTALDVTVQAKILNLIASDASSRDLALLWISHDLAVVATICQRVLVMTEGAIVETGPVDQVLTKPQHPYTRRLIAASALAPRSAASR